MRDISGFGPFVDVTEGRSPSNPDLLEKLGVRLTCFQQLSKYGLASTIAQYYGLVQHGLLDAAHLFEGINRPLMHGDDKNVDKSVLVYSWRPELDFEWEGSRQDGWPVQRIPPFGRVFVVLVRPELASKEHQESGDVFGSIDKWNWVKEDPNFAGAPVDWADRYDRKIWSRDT